MLDWIADHCEKPIDEFVVLEIGSYVGDSTAIFADNVKQVYSVDPFENGYDKDDDSSHKHDMAIVEKQFDELVKAKGNIIKNKMTSEDASMDFGMQMFDLIYVDGEHTYEAVKKDIELWLIRARYFIAGHDYQNRHHPYVAKAVQDSVGEPHQTFRDTSWIKKI